MALILGIETSCDECSVAVVEGQSSSEPLRIRTLKTFSQITIHQPYGGVVPEIASRSHLETILPVLEAALSEAGVQPEELDALAVTNRPGLVGALLVGVTTAKALAYVWNKPLIDIHHLEGHLASAFLAPDAASRLKLPAVVLIVSGGHTQLHVIREIPEKWTRTWLRESCVGRTRDDAAGEAFDKIGKLLGFGYPAGPLLEKAAEGGNPQAFRLPRALPQKAVFDFSFSGLKTSAAQLFRTLEQKGELATHRSDFCASVQAAIVDALATKVELLVEREDAASVICVGGVAANQQLRARLDQLSVPWLAPPLSLCTDNGAMIGAAGLFRWLGGYRLPTEKMLELNAMAYAEV